MRKVISNTSCLIALSNIQELELLKKVYGKIYITPEVAAKFGETLPDWIGVLPMTDHETDRQYARYWRIQHDCARIVVS